MTAYADSDDLVRLSVMTSTEVAGYSSDVVGGTLDAASAMIDSRCRAVSGVPLASIDDHIKLITCKLSCKLLRDPRGYDQDSPLRQQTQEGWDWALRELDLIAKALVAPSGLVDTSPSTATRAILRSSDQRGW